MNDAIERLEEALKKSENRSLDFLYLDALTILKRNENIDEFEDDISDISEQTKDEGIKTVLLNILAELRNNNYN